jgi:uncharacterized membrane protein HdeD (DUF308 family)
MALRGVLAVCLGLFAFLVPFATITALMWLAGAYFLVDGGLATVAAIRAFRENRHWGWLLFEGILSIAAGLTSFFLPEVTALIFLCITAAWAIITGGLQIGMALRLRKEIEGEWMWILGGIASIALGFALVLFPAAGLVAWAWLLGAYFLVFGALTISFAMMIRGEAHRLFGPPSGLTSSRRGASPA